MFATASVPSLRNYAAPARTHAAAHVSNSVSIVRLRDKITHALADGGNLRE
jgi:hypothetical protein